MRKILLGAVVLLFCFSGCDTGAGVEAPVVEETPLNSISIINAPSNLKFFMWVYECADLEVPESKAAYESIAGGGALIGNSEQTQSPFTINWNVEAGKIPNKVFISVFASNNITRFTFAEFDADGGAAIDWEAMTDLSSLPAVGVPDNSISVLNLPGDGNAFVRVYQNNESFNWSQDGYYYITGEDELIGDSIQTASPFTVIWSADAGDIPVKVLVEVRQGYTYKFEFVELDAKHRATVDWNTMTDVDSLVAYGDM